MTTGPNQMLASPPGSRLALGFAPSVNGRGDRGAGKVISAEGRYRFGGVPRRFNHPPPSPSPGDPQKPYCALSLTPSAPAASATASTRGAVSSDRRGL